MVKTIKITIGDVTFSVDNDIFETNVELNEKTIAKCLEMVNYKDSPSDYQIGFIANNTILRVKPK